MQDQTALLQQFQAFLAVQERQQSETRTVGGIYGLTASDLERYEGIVWRITRSEGFADPGFDHERPDSFGNLVRIAVVRKQEAGTKVQASRQVWRRVLRDCADWPTDPRQFRVRLDGYLSEYMLERSAKTGKPRSNQSYNNLLSIIKSVWTEAVRMDIVETTPVPAEKYPKRPIKARNRPLLLEERETVLSVLRSRHEPLYWAATFSLKNPIRYGDLRRLECRNVDLNAGLIEYTAEKTGVPGMPIIYDDIRPYIQSRVIAGHKYVFDLPVNYHGTWRHVLDSGIENLTWHDFRHHAATWLVEHNVPLSKVAAIGAWASTKMPEQYHNLGARSAALSVRDQLLRAA